MDLAKIIAELRVELQCLDTAIASMEELARVQNVLESSTRPELPSGMPPGEPESAPVKRRRGRPPKHAPAIEAADEPEVSESANGDPSTAG